MIIVYSVIYCFKNNYFILQNMSEDEKFDSILYGDETLLLAGVVIQWKIIET